MMTTCAMATSQTEILTKSAPRPHGVKRAASDVLENEQRLSKRFDLLNLDHNGGKLYIPVSSAETRNLHRMHSPPPKPRIEPMDDELMQVEDTPHRVFIYDLDKELADIESDEENPIFLADIEKHMNKIPRHILVDEKSLKPTDTNQLVLYNVPASITVPEEQDNVRKAIVEARARIRQQQAFNCNNFGSGDARIRPAEDNAMMDTQGLSNGVPPSSSAGLGMKRSMQDDPDAMEIEEEL